MYQVIEQNRSTSQFFAVSTQAVLEDRDKSARTARQTKCSTPLPLPRSAYPYFACSYRSEPSKVQRHTAQR